MQDDSAGFSIHPAVLGESEMERVGKAMERIPRRSRAGARHLMSDPVVGPLARDERLVSLAEAILGGPATPYRATLFDKSQRSNWLVAWHQDTALSLRSRQDVPGWGPWSAKGGVVYAHAPAAVLEDVIALRVHLDDSTAANGPLRVLPGTHRLGILSDVQVAEVARSIDARACTVGRGGVVTMRPLLVHASSKTSTGAPRRVLHIEYAASLRLSGGLEIAFG